ncbi:diol dehydratase small subunit [Cryptosporangium japonicum]|uniref:Propanediol dehydratase small subunit n=1 Tax=Cryptosporangium japonicum TaxID=80872 RepID=A0ABP3E6U7_9ACTN
MSISQGAPDAVAPDAVAPDAVAPDAVAPDSARVVGRSFDAGAPDGVRAFSGRALESVTLDAVRAGEVSTDDLRIHPETLEHQAQVAADHGNPQLAANFRRAAELTAIDDTDVMRIYEALRPRRSTFAELEEIADWLSERGAVINAALVREAAQVYQRRGLCR